MKLYNASKALLRTKMMPRLAYQLLLRAAKNQVTHFLPMLLLEATQSLHVKHNREPWTTVYTNNEIHYMLIARGEKNDQQQTSKQNKP
jgi:hypothetical protein